MARVLRFISQPWTPTRIGDELKAAFEPPCTEVVAAIGFANASGVRHIAPELAALVGRGGKVKFLVGLDGTITSAPAVRALMSLGVELWVFRHPARPLFHPKTYLFRSGQSGLAVVGSANLTESALWVNYEDAVVTGFDLTASDDEALFDQFQQTFSSAVASANAQRATVRLVRRIEKAGLLPSEARSRRKTERRDRAADEVAALAGLGSLFPATAAPPPPTVPLLPEEIADAAANPPPRRSRTGTSPPGGNGTRRVRRAPARRGFVLRLNPGDAGIRPGHSADIFIPLAAMRGQPAFWGTFSSGTSPERRLAIEVVRRAGNSENVTPRLYQTPKDDLRLNSRELQADAVGGDLLRLELAPPGAGVEYVGQIVKPGDPAFARFDAIASNVVRRSKKRWGYY